MIVVYRDGQFYLGIESETEADYCHYCWADDLPLEIKKVAERIKGGDHITEPSKMVPMSEKAIVVSDNVTPGVTVAGSDHSLTQPQLTKINELLSECQIRNPGGWLYTRQMPDKPADLSSWQAHKIINQLLEIRKKQKIQQSVASS